MDFGGMCPPLLAASALAEPSFFRVLAYSRYLAWLLTLLQALEKNSIRNRLNSAKSAPGKNHVPRRGAFGSKEQ